MYDWEILFRNDRMGFVKRIHVQEESSIRAIDAGYRQIESRNYKRDDFDVVELKRSGDGRS
jgi:hypothetical protein